MIFNNIDKLCEDLGQKYFIDEPIKDYVTFKIGGNAKRFITVTNEYALAKILEKINSQNIPYFILGKGSNLLVKDAGFDGVIIQLSGDFSQVTLKDDNTVSCGAGASLASLCNFAKANSLTGLEFAWGIPGTAGGAAYMNAGAYGGEMKDVLTSCNHVDENGKLGTFSKDELKLSYRKSAYTDTKMAITSLTLTLKKGNKEEISSKMNELLQKRKDKQPLEYPSAGSTFKRPEGYFAAALIEECGLKGFTLGGAMVSDKHSGFVVNKNNATAKDVLDLIEEVKRVVKEKKSVELECEVKILG